MNNTLTIENITHRYKDTIALNQVALTLSTGTYGLLGRNGAGKTTLLSLIASIFKPQKGKILLNETPVFENAKAMESINILYHREFTDEPTKVIKYFEECAIYRPNFNLDEAKQLAKQFKCPLDKPLSALSSGMKSVVSIIEGIASHTAVTLFDEVHVHMDAYVRELFYDVLLNTQKDDPRIIILSTHLVSEMAHLFDHVCIIDSGKIIIDEPIDELLSRGTNLTGNKENIDSLTKPLNIVHEKRLGNVKQVSVFGQLSKEVLESAKSLNVTIEPITLQDLFIHLTKGGEQDEE